MKKVLVVLAVLAAPVAVSAALAQPGPGGGQHGGPGSGMERLQAIDLNHDGAITKAEAAAAREAAFRALDTNNDGFVTDAEKQAHREAAAKKRRQRGGGNDADGDGKISRAEFVNAPYRMFDRLDTNHNDIIDASEIAAARTLMQQRKQGTP